MNKEATFKIFPNPTSGTVKVEGAFSASQAFRVYSSVGALISEGVLDKNVIGFSDLKTGIYFLKIGNQVVRFQNQ